VFSKKRHGTKSLAPKWFRHSRRLRGILAKIV
jgi:hypothetical protein